MAPINQSAVTAPPEGTGVTSTHDPIRPLLEARRAYGELWRAAASRGEHAEAERLMRESLRCTQLAVRHTERLRCERRRAAEPARLAALAEHRKRAKHMRDVVLPALAHAAPDFFESLSPIERFAFAGALDDNPAWLRRAS